MENLNVVSLNVRGLQNTNKRNRIFQYFKIKKYDVILLQEMYSTLEDENKWKKEWEYPTFFSSLSNHKCGVAILCTNSENKLKATYARSCKARKHVSIDTETELISYRITNIYAPNIPKKRKKFFQKLETQFANINNILGGEFNMVEDILKDRAGGNPTTQHYGIEYIRNMKNNNNTIDIWREKSQIRENIYISTT